MLSPAVSMILLTCPHQNLKPKLWKGQLEAGLRGGFFISLGVEYCVAQGTMLLVPGSLELLMKPHNPTSPVYMYMFTSWVKRDKVEAIF